MMTEHYESNKFYDVLDALDAFDFNTQLVMAEHHDSNKFYDDFDVLDASHAFDSNAPFFIAEH